MPGWGLENSSSRTSNNSNSWPGIKQVENINYCFWFQSYHFFCTYFRSLYLWQWTQLLITNSTFMKSEKTFELCRILGGKFSRRCANHQPHQLFFTRNNKLDIAPAQNDPQLTKFSAGTCSVSRLLLEFHHKYWELSGLYCIVVFVMRQTLIDLAALFWACAKYAQFELELNERHDTGHNPSQKHKMLTISLVRNPSNG